MVQGDQKGYRSGHFARALGLVLACLSAFAAHAAPGAAAQTNVTWIGASSSPNWSDASNWSGGTPSAGDDLSFPSGPSSYTTDNDFSGLSVNGLAIDDSDHYTLNGNALTVGPGGITASSGSSGTGPATVNLPLALGAAQTWTFSGGPSTSGTGIDAEQAVTGDYALSVSFAQSGFLEFDGDVEVGKFAASGPGSIVLFGSLNETDHSPVTLDGAGLDVSSDVKIGPLTSTGAAIADGYGSSPDGTLAVGGAVTLDSSSTLQTYIDANGSTAGTDYSQLTATGNVALAGTLKVSLGNDGSSCDVLNPGDSATLISTTGTLSGAFGNVVVNSACSGAAAPNVEISYTPHAVIATVISTTATTLAESPSSSVTNQPVTLTATVTAVTGQPSGTVQFDDDGTAISGCSAQPVTNGTATCKTSFAAASSPEQLSAAFTGATGSGDQPSSTTTATSYTVGPDATATSLSASDTQPTAGASVTFTATVGPADTGPQAPTGMIEFSEDGTALPGCGGEPPSATCTITIAAGEHTITASYSGDANFGDSGPASVTVDATVPPPPPSPPPPPPPPAVSGITGAATAVQTTTATLRGIVNTAGAALSWQFELGLSTVYDKGTTIEAIGAGQGSVPVSATITGLHPATVYHYALVVIQGGSAIADDGADQTFTTAANGALLLTATRLSVLGHTVRVTERCTSAQPCSGRFSIAVRLNGRSETCASASYRVNARARGMVATRLAGACLTKLRAARGHGLTAAFSSHPRTAQFGVVKQVSLVLQQPRRV